MSRDRINEYRDWLEKSIENEADDRKNEAYKDSLKEFNSIFEDGLDVDYAQLQKDIGSEIKKRRTAKGISASEMNKKLAGIFGLSELTTADWRVNVEQGFMYGSTSSTAKESNKEIYLNSLAAYLKLLGVDTRDELIEQIVIVDDMFAFPLSDSAEISYRPK